MSNFPNSCMGQEFEGGGGQRDEDERSVLGNFTLTM